MGGVRKIKGRLSTLASARVAVLATRIKTSSVFELHQGIESIALLAPGTPILIPEKIEVMCNGEEVQPSGYFAITAETIDPYHFILDMF